MNLTLTAQHYFLMEFTFYIVIRIVLEKHLKRNNFGKEIPQ